MGSAARRPSNAADGAIQGKPGTSHPSEASVGQPSRALYIACAELSRSARPVTASAPSVEYKKAETTTNHTNNTNEDKAISN